LRTHAVSDGQAKVFEFGIARTRSIRTIEIPSGQTAMYGCGKHCKTSPSLILNRGWTGALRTNRSFCPGIGRPSALYGADFAVVIARDQGSKLELTKIASHRPDQMTVRRNPTDHAQMFHQSLKKRAFDELRLISAFRTETISGAVQTAA
jgi:hypothetical protein